MTDSHQKEVVVQYEWLESRFDLPSDPILTHCMGIQQTLHLMSREELIDMNRDEFLRCVWFCDTDIVQKHLRTPSIVPDTYESDFAEFFNRKIEKMTWAEYVEKYANVPKFIKPVGNLKGFTGRVFPDFEDFLLSENTPNLSDLIYVVEPVKIKSEARLLIGSGNLYGSSITVHGESPDYRDQKDFIQKLIEITGNRYRCIDIGYMENPETKEWKWSVVEVNPPFSLDAYEIPFADYMEFCSGASDYLYARVK